MNNTGFNPNVKYEEPNIIFQDFPLDDLIFPPQHIRNDFVPQPFTSTILVARDKERENTINQEYLRVISSPEYQADTIAYVKVWILRRKEREDDKWIFPEDDVLKRLRQELGI